MCTPAGRTNASRALLIAYLVKGGPSTLADNVDGLPKIFLLLLILSANVSTTGHIVHDLSLTKSSSNVNSTCFVYQHSMNFTAPIPKQTFVSL